MISDKLNILEDLIVKVSQRVKVLDTELQNKDAQLANLNRKISEKDKQITLLEEKIQFFQLARGQSTDSGEARKAKNRINELVKEIDKCIALLNH